MKIMQTHVTKGERGSGCPLDHGESRSPSMGRDPTDCGTLQNEVVFPEGNTLRHLGDKEHQTIASKQTKLSQQKGNWRQWPVLSLALTAEEERYTFAIRIHITRSHARSSEAWIDITPWSYKTQAEIQSKHDNGITVSSITRRHRHKYSLGRGAVFKTRT